MAKNVKITLSTVDANHLARALHNALVASTAWSGHGPPPTLSKKAPAKHTISVDKKALSAIRKAKPAKRRAKKRATKSKAGSKRK